MTIPEWWLVFLPALFLLGWLAARLDIDHIIRSSRRLPKSYLRGLSHLLRDEPDRALEAFLAAQPLDPESVELEFAIGALFRRRGEIERALRIHAAIARREDLPAAAREDAVLELARDYFKTGFLDRAEKLCGDLRNGRYNGEALLLLFQIHQMERDFARAVEAVAAMDDEARQARRADIAQLHCEWADSLPADSEHDARRNELWDAALAANPYCVRATLARARRQMAGEKFNDAASTLLKVETQDAAMLWQAAEPLAQAYAAAGRKDEARAVLSRWLEAHPDPLLLERAAAAFADDRDTAGEWIKRALENTGGFTAPALFARWMAGGGDGAWRRLEESLAAARPARRFQCRECGLDSTEFQWQCRGCRAWESLRLAR